MLAALSEVKFSPQCPCRSPSCACPAGLLAGLRQSPPVGPWGLVGRGHQLFPIAFILAHTIYIGQELCLAKNVQWGEWLWKQYFRQNRPLLLCCNISVLQLVLGRIRFNGNVNNSIDFWQSVCFPLNWNTCRTDNTNYSKCRILAEGDKVALSNGKLKWETAFK